MTNGYDIFWTDHAKDELKETLQYLEAKWAKKDIQNFSIRLEKVIKTISETPLIFQTVNENKSIRRAVITKHNTLFFRLSNNKIELLSLFSVRQNPDKSKIFN